LQSRNKDSFLKIFALTYTAFVELKQLYKIGMLNLISKEPLIYFCEELSSSGLYTLTIEKAEF
jgi:hypothetical protein